MTGKLSHRNFLNLMDFTPEEIRYLLNMSKELKAAKANRTEIQHLVGKEIALIFEKSSTRTRCGRSRTGCSSARPGRSSRSRS